MSSANNDTTDQEPPRVSPQRIQPLVDLIVAQLTATQWAKVTSGSIDQETKEVITGMCVDLVNALCKIVNEEFENRPSQSKSKTAGSPEVIYEEEIQRYLGTSITDAFESVTGSPVSKKSAERLTDLVSKEVTERINSPAEVSGRGEFKITRRLQIIARHVISMLKHCKTKMSCASRTRTADSQSPRTAADSTSPLESLREETPVSLFGAEDRCSVGSFMDTTTEAVKQILLEHVSDPEVKFNADISEEEQQQIVNSINEDADEAACEIAQYIWSNREDCGLNNDGTPRPDAQSSRLNCWNVVANKIKILFVRKFAKEAIATFIVKLRTKLDCRKAPLDVLIPAADKVVQDMIPENPEECPYKTMAICISNGQHEAHSQHLGHIIFENLQRVLGARKVNLVMIEMEIQKFMNMMRNWLNQQRQKLTKENNRVFKSLKKIQGALDLPELPEDIVTPVKSAAPSTTAESGVNGDEDIISTPVTEPRPPSITDEPGDKDVSTTPVPEPRPPSITDEPGDKDVSTTPVPEPRPPSLTDEPGVADEGMSITPVCDRSPSIADEDDDYSPKFECVGARVPDKTALRDSTRPSANMYRGLLVMAVVDQCLKTTQITVSKDESNRIISTLKDMFHIGNVDFQPTGREIKETAKAVHKNLCATMGGKGVVAMNLLSEDSEFYECVIETLKRQLAKPKKTGIKTFFTTLLHIVSKPFERCPCSVCD
ncbi:hypothetical protein GBF38_014487 [Nibea albiflora]|uniref:Uncharacterized protein n=1 Tax=Nibea albiflora TaxID=240163 RepID=A0ACB7F8A2_NIBAL|nr:hypothetical protein GBF38_014487 [Nibea albiflora]